MVSPFTLFLGAIGAIVVLLIVLWLVKRSKGKIEINLTNFQFSPGDVIEGDVVLKLKKPVQAKALKVGLIGIYQNTNYGKSPKGYSRSSTKSYAFEFRQPIDGEKEYPSGDTSYHFKLKIPQDLLSSRAFGDGALGTIVKSVQILSGNISSIKWYVEANLDMKGFNISRKVQVNIA